MKSRLTLFESLKLLVLALFAILLVPVYAFGEVVLQSPAFWRVCMRGIDVTSDLGKLAKAWGLVNDGGGIKSQAVQIKTANYQVLTTDPSDSVFTNRGAAGAVTFTLPAVTRALTGVRYRFIGVVAAQTIAVAGAAGTVVTFNNAAATSVTCSTAGQLIGAEIVAECDGTSWLVRGTTVGVTYTVA